MSWYSRVPKDPLEQIQFRKFVIERGGRSKTMQATLWQACSEDILFFFNCFVLTYDPRLKGEKNIPFNTYPFQDKAILELKSAIEDGEDEVMQKSRCMGASWMLVGVFVWFSIFRRNCKFLMMSRNADLVDSDDSDSLFWKLDFIHEWLPSWILDKDRDVHRIKSKMKVNYLKSGSQITGTTTTKSSSIGGRATAAGIDEYSRYDPIVARLLKSGLRPVTNCCLWNFTPNPEMGKAHPSYELVEQASRGDIRSLRMHWRDHPEYVKGLYRVDRNDRTVEVIDKTYPFPPKYKFQTDGVFEYHSVWFDAERIRVGNDRDMKELYEIDYDGSGFAFFDERVISEYIVQHARPPKIEGDLFYDEKGNNPKFVVQPGGRIKLWCDLGRNGKPAPCHYAEAVDVSLGVGTTPSCITVGDIATGEKVMELQTAVMDPHEFAILAVAVARWFSSIHCQTLLAWERKGPGETFGKKVIDLGYTFVYIPPVNESKFSKKPGETPGFNPGPATKRSMLLLYQSSLSTRAFLNRSKESLMQCYQWQNTAKGPQHKQTMNKSEDPSGATENHGDLVISDALCNKMIVERGGGKGKNELLIVAPPGSLAWHRREDERALADRDVLYSNWERPYGALSRR